MKNIPALTFKPPPDIASDPSKLQAYLGQVHSWLEHVEWQLAAMAAASGAAFDHGALSGKDDDDHTQYAGIAQTETISGVWTHTAELKMVGAAFTDEIPVDLAVIAEQNVPSTSNYFNLTGGGTITGPMGLVTAGRRVLFRFNAATTINHDATTLILLSAKNTLYEAGDHAMFMCIDGTNWREVWRSPGTLRDLSYWRQVGTSPLECWYPAGTIACGATGTYTAAADEIEAVPFIAPRGGTLDRIGVRCSGAVALGAAVLGIYANSSDTNLYPGALVLDAGTISLASTGAKTATISQSLSQGRLYWLAINFNNSVATLISVGAANAWPLFGVTSGMDVAARAYITATEIYDGTLPSTFPAGGTAPSGGDPPRIAVRYSA